MLELNNIDFSYPNQPIFNNCNLTISRGEFVFLIGNSGVGKSTLFQLILMNLMPENGEIIFEDFSSKLINHKSLPELRRKIGVVFQDFKLLEDRNIYDNLSFILKVTGTPSKQIKRKVIHALNEVGLSNKQKNMPNQLSGGEKQRVSIARAIINEPLLLLADEPTGNLDPQTSEEILKILTKINARGTTVIFATHDYGLVKRSNKKIIKLHEGKAVKVVFKK